MTHPLFRWLLTVAGGFLLVAANPVYGGERTNIPSVGMARTGTAVGFGLDAIGFNPANLAAQSEGTVTFTIIPVAMHAGSDVFTLDLYNTYLTGEDRDGERVARYITDLDKGRILNRFGSQGTARTMADASVRLFGLSLHLGEVGSFALSVTERVGVFVDMPADYLRFLFYGNLPGSVYDFGATAMEAVWVRDYSLSYARSLPSPAFFRSLRAGITLKYVSGYASFGIDRFATRLETAENGVLSGRVSFRSHLAGRDLVDDGVTTRYGVFPSPAGSGYGIDLGVSADVDEAIAVGLSVADIGSVRWTRYLEERSVDSVVVVDDPLNPDQRDRIERSLTGETREGQPFTTSLPTTLRLGVAVRMHRLSWLETMPGELVVAADFSQGFFEVPGTTRRPRVSFGMEYRIVRWFPLRAGVSFGGTDWYNVAVGTGLNFGGFDFDIATENLEGLVDQSSLSFGSVAFGMKVRL